MKLLNRLTCTKGFVDLHNHTDFSYGHEMGKMKITPVQFLDEMAEYANKYSKVVTFSITDHNDIIANNRIIEAMKKNPEKYKYIRYIPGVEYTASTDSLGHCYDDAGNEHPIVKNNKLHMLAYGMNLNDPDIKYLNTLMSTSPRFSITWSNAPIPVKLGNAIFATKKWLREIGKEVSLTEFRKNCQLKTTYGETLVAIENFLTNSLKLSHDEINEWYAFVTNYSNLIKNTKPDVMEVIDIVEKAGGYCVLAHPGALMPSDAFQKVWQQNPMDPRNKKYAEISFEDAKYKSLPLDEKHRNFRRMENYFDYIYRTLTLHAKNPITGEKLHGIIGHELMHPSNQKNPYKFQSIMRTGDKYGLYCTGGSDSHGFMYQYAVPSRIVGAQVQKYDTTFDSIISVYTLTKCTFADDYFKSLATGAKLDRRLGKTARKQLNILKCAETGEHEYNMNQFEEVIFESFERKKIDDLYLTDEKQEKDSYDIAEEEIKEQCD